MLFLRLALIISLVAQQALAFACCGVQIMRPDIIRGACDMPCAVVGASDHTSSNSIQAQALASSSCCGTQATCESDDDSACERVSTPQGCCGAYADAHNGSPCSEMTACGPVVEQKKSGPELQQLSIIAAVAHPAVPPMMIPSQAPGTFAARLMPRWPSHHQQRQAMLAVWVI